MKAIDAPFQKGIRLAFLWAALVSAYFYFGQIIVPNLEARKQLVESLASGHEKADYLYAMFFVASLHHLLTAQFGHALIWHTLTDCGGMLFLFWSAYHFIRTEFGTLPGFVAGGMYMIIPLPLFLVDHFYHPTDFWAAGLVFFMLKAARAENHLMLSGLLFLSGMMWEKALFVPLIYGMYLLYRRGAAAALRGVILPVAAALFWFVYFRFTFPDAPRVLLATTTVFMKNLPDDLLMWSLYLLPLAWPLGIYWKNGRATDPFWLFWLLYIPILIVTLIWLTAYWGELRTFWILQPIIVAFAAAVFSTDHPSLKKLSID